MTIVVLVAIMSFATYAASESDWITLCEQMKNLRVELARQGAYAFVTNRATTPSIAPYIHSQCWVDWLPEANVGQIAYEREKRGFGSDFFVEIERLALPDITLDDIDALERHAVKMLRIAEWLKTSDGYGNHILKSWCEGVAMSAMGGMAVNSGCDTNRVVELLARIDCLQTNIARRVSILNEEAPHRYKMPKCSTYDEAARDLERQCHPHKLKTWKYYGKKDGRRYFTFDHVKEDPPEYAFYVPDRKDGQWESIRTWWDMRDHEAVCVYGLENEMAEQIRQILRYRTLVGDIPKPTEEEINDLHLAFDYSSRLDDVWQKLTKGKEFYFLGASAVLKIYRHTFVDWLTRSLQFQREAEMRRKLDNK
jgi:hypothetical protein